MAETPKSERRFYPNLKGKIPDEADRAIRILFDNLYELQTTMNTHVTNLTAQNAALTKQVNALQKK